MQGQQQAVDRNAQQSETNRRNALLKMEETQFNQGQDDRAKQQADSTAFQNALVAGDRDTILRLNPETARQMDQDAAKWGQNGVGILMSVKDDPVQFQAVAAKLAADPRAKWLGVDISHITPDAVAALAAQIGGGMPQPQDTGPLQEYVGPGGKPIYGTRADALGQQAYHAPPAPQQPQPPVQFLDDKGNPVWGTREQALGKRPVPPQASLKDQLDADKVTEAKSRVSGNLDALSEYYGELSNLGAAVDTNNEGAGNVSAAIRASGPGQLGGRLFGTKEQSVRNRINQMRPLLLQEIRQASAMGARGLDSNKELEFYLQAATDPARDLQANQAALNVLSKAYGLGKDYGAVSPDAVTKLNSSYLASLPKVTNAAEYAAISKGSEYVDKDGNRRKKP